jgi:hypothetical protein
LSNVAAIAAGAYHSLALKADGTIVAWGSNSNGQLDVPADLGNVVAIAAGRSYSLALKRDGTVVVWGASMVPDELANGVAIAAGARHSLALKADGTVVAWGWDYAGQSSVPIAAQAGVVAIAAGGNHSLALKADGTIVAWGDNSYSQSTVPGGLINVVALAAGDHHSLALKADGTIVAWGWNGSGQCTVPAAAQASVAALAAGDYYSLALKADGTVVAWGDNYYGQLNVPAGLANVSAIAALGNSSLALGAIDLAAMMGDGQSASAGQTFTTPLTIRLTGPMSQPLVGVTTTFSAPGSGSSASLSSPAAVTDANGQARVLATANAIAGSYTVIARYNGPYGPAVSFTLTNTPATPASVSVTGGDKQLAAIGQPFSQPLQVIVHDTLGATAPNVTVTFSAPGSGASASLSNPTAITDAAGRAQVTATANRTVGRYTVVARINGAESSAVSFYLTNTVQAYLPIIVR